MELLPLKLPDGARLIYSSLYDSNDMSIRDEDILVVALPDEVAIDVGWYPPCDASGCFWIRACRGDWENQLLRRSIKTTDPHQVVREVEKLAIKLLRHT